MLHTVHIDFGYTCNPSYELSYELSFGRFVRFVGNIREIKLKIPLIHNQCV